MKHVARSVLDYDPNLETTVTAMKQIYATQVLGPIAIGNCLFLLLDGAALLLAGFVWAKRRHQLSKQNRWNLRLLLLFNLVCIAFSFQDIFYLMTSNNRTYEDLYTFTTPEALQMLWGGCIALIVQLFLIKRTAHFMSSSKYIVHLLYAGAIVSFLGCIFVTIENFLTDRDIGPEDLLLAANQIWLWASAVTDLAISGVLAWKLTSMKSGFRVETDELIDRVVRITIGSAAPTALFASLAGISFVATFDNWLYDFYYVFIIPLPAFYTLSFLYAISGYNAETRGSSGTRTTDHQMGPVSTSQRKSFTHMRKSSTKRAETSIGSGIFVEVDRITTTDTGDGASIIGKDYPGRFGVGKEDVTPAQFLI